MLATLQISSPLCIGEWLFAPPAAMPEAMHATGDFAAQEGDAVPAEAGLDAALVAATLGGDDAAFGELVRRHKTRIFGMATRFARDAHEREDLCQEIFVQAYRKLRDFRGESPFGHWLGRLAVRKCYDLLRRTRRERDSSVPLDAVLYLEEDPAAGRERSGREAREILARAMAPLSAEERLVITLLELEDTPIREIAALMGWSETNVRTRAYRARAALKKSLELQGTTFP